MTKKIDENLNLNKIILIILISYFLIAISFYFLSDEQLHFRNSRGNIELEMVDSITTELYSGAKIEQIFVPQIQRLKEISVQFGTFQRNNSGNVNIEIYELNNNSLLLNKNINMSEIKDGDLISLKFEKPVENLYKIPLIIKIYSKDSDIGKSVTVLMNSKKYKEGFNLYVNGENRSGMICFTAKGEDYIWIGLHYWKIVTIIGILILIYMFVVSYKYKHGKKNILLYFMIAVKKYRFLIRQLISRDFRTKYKRSVLGVLWSFLNPLLMMIVQYFVFSNLFKTDIPNYLVYLLIGVVMFNFFIEACSMTLMSIVGNASLITKVYVPKYIYPISRVLSSAVNLIISLIPLSFVIIFTKNPITKSYLLAIFPLLFIIIFTLGLGMILSSSMVFFRDTQFLWGVLSMIWMYATPIFYPESIIPQEFKFILQYNPIYYFIKLMRICILEGIAPEPFLFIQSCLISISMLILGSIIFKKAQDRFILYI